MQIAYRPFRNFIIFIIVACIVYYAFSTWGDHMDSKIQEGFIQFNTSDIRGKLESTSIQYHMTAFKLQNDNKEYIISPYPTVDGRIFFETAERGDSIIKTAYSDTLILLRGSERYEFTFRNLLKN